MQLHMESQKKNIHAGHRQRLRDLSSRVGLKNLTDVQIVEQLLFYTHKRCDTNEIAHNLLTHFGSISRIMDATESELLQVKGVGKVTAQFFATILQLFNIYTEEKLSEDREINTLADIHTLIYPYFKFEKQECIYLAYIDKTNKLTICEKLAEGDIANVSVSISEIVQKLVKRSEKKYIFAHNHPHGTVYPSSTDCDTYYELCSIFGQLGLELVDCIIIDKEKYYSIKNATIIYGNPKK